MLRLCQSQRLGEIFVQAEDVALRIREPRGLLGPQNAHVLHGLETGQVVVGEDDAVVFKRGNRRANVLDWKLMAVCWALVPPSRGKRAISVPRLR